MDKKKLFFGLAAAVVTFGTVAATTMKDPNFDYYQKGTACVPIAETSCIISAPFACLYLDPATGVNYPVFEARTNVATCNTPLKKTTP